ncbi:MAG: FHA domain-containing protein [Myxococcota bacterium]
MGRIENPRTGMRVMLLASHRLGRSRANDTVLAQDAVSGEHALIGWDDGWRIRDLGSRNGTFVNGEAVAPGTRRPLVEGDAVSFGTVSDPWTVASVAPPAPWADDGTTVVEGHPGLLALPSVDDPQVVIRYDAEAEAWSLDDEPVDDGAVLEAYGRSWTVRLPEGLAPTRSLSPEGLALDDATLHFRVSRDEEYVELAIELPGAVHRPKPRAHHYLLLTLARARLADQAEGLEGATAGWRHAEDVERMLRSSKNHIHVGIYRIRRELAELGVVDGEHIVERRRSSQHLRIGVASLRIETL